MSRGDEMDHIIETLDLCKTYGLGSIEVEVLKNINVNISKGDFVSIMGP